MSLSHRKASLLKQLNSSHAVDEQLSKVLREQYREIQSEPIPERLQDLIDALREIETNSSDQD